MRIGSIKSSRGEPNGYDDVLRRREQLLWERQEELSRSQTAHFESSFKSLLNQNEAMQRLLEQLLLEREQWKVREDQLFQQIDRLQSENREMKGFLGQAIRSSSQASGRLEPVQEALEDEMRPQEGAVKPDMEAKATKEDGKRGRESLIEPNRQQTKGIGDDENNEGSSARQTHPDDRQQSIVPPWTLELKAAMAAVDEFDVLAEDLDFRELAKRAAAAKEAALSSNSKRDIDLTAQTAQQAVRDMQNDFNKTDPEESTESFSSSVKTSASEDMSAGPPPTLSLGADDIFWVNQLHTAMSNAGYYAGDEDVEDFYFGESTQSAVLTYQCCEGLTETGVVDEAMWIKLLGPDLAPVRSEDLYDTNSAQDSSGGRLTEAKNDGGVKSDKPYSEFFSAIRHASASLGPDGDVDIDEEMITQDTIALDDGSVVQSTVSTSAHAHFGSWPVLMDGDGGRGVHALHVALGQQGFHAGEDDMRWWQFGDGTTSALKTFQACSGLPETGVCDVNTWKMLLGPDAKPEHLRDLRSGDSYDEDLSHVEGEERVWLLGEQRWENRRRMSGQ